MTKMDFLNEIFLFKRSVTEDGKAERFCRKLATLKPAKNQLKLNT